MVQPTPKQMTREQKEAKVEEFRNHIENSEVVGILDMHALPARQLQDIKQDMKDFATMRMSRKTLMNLGIDQADIDGIEELKENEATQPAFIFSEKDAFQLYSLIQNNKTSAAAKGGEEAPNDITVEEGDTGIGPGPMLGQLQQAGLNVQVQDGSIHVMEEATIIEEGDTITADDAEILNELGIEPLEIGLDLDVAYSEGQLFTADELDIDLDKYREDIEAAASSAFNLAVNAGHVTERTAPTVVQQAVTKAKNLSTNEGLPEEETIEDSISVAASNAEGVDSQVDLDDVEVDSEDDNEEKQEESEDTETEDETEESDEESEDEESDSEENKEE